VTCLEFGGISGKSGGNGLEFGSGIKQKKPVIRNARLYVEPEFVTI